MQARSREYLAGALVAVVGLAVTLEARSFGMGTMARTGPGFFPTVLGVALTLVGVLIAATGGSGGGGGGGSEGGGLGRADWRGWGCILAGVAAFIVLGEAFGLGPATFGCVFISAWGDREAGLRSALLLAVAATVVAGVVFSWGLKFQLPLVRW